MGYRRLYISGERIWESLPRFAWRCRYRGSVPREGLRWRSISLQRRIIINESCWPHDRDLNVSRSMTSALCAYTVESKPRCAPSNSSGANLTFESRLPPGSCSNVKFKSSTRSNKLLVVLMIQTFATAGAAQGGKCLNRTTSRLLKLDFGSPQITSLVE